VALDPNFTQSQCPGTAPEGQIVVGRFDRIAAWARQHTVNWARRNSLWPLPFATACCGIELMATAASRYDIARFGAEVLRFSPRQADVLFVAGRVVVKMMPVLQRIYLQMAEPRWVISMGACASTSGVFNTYAVVPGIDRYMPVDVYIPGCPPRPEALLEAIMAIQRLIDDPDLAKKVRRPLGLVIERDEKIDSNDLPAALSNKPHHQPESNIS